MVPFFVVVVVVYMLPIFSYICSCYILKCYSQSRKLLNFIFAILLAATYFHQSCGIYLAIYSKVKNMFGLHNIPRNSFSLFTLILALLSHIEIVHTIFIFRFVMWPLESELLNNGLKREFLKLTQLISCRMLWLLQLSYCDFSFESLLYIFFCFMRTKCVSKL